MHTYLRYGIFLTAFHFQRQSQHRRKRFIFKAGIRTGILIPEFSVQGVLSLHVQLLGFPLTVTEIFQILFGIHGHRLKLYRFRRKFLKTIRTPTHFIYKLLLHSSFILTYTFL